MPQPLIRFACPCGKRVAAPPEFAGKKAKCPKCGNHVTVPAVQPSVTRPQPSAKSQREPCHHPALEDCYQKLVTHFENQIDHHEVTRGCPSLRFLIPEDRHQVIKLHVEKDANELEWLVVQSEIGTISTLEETTKALKLNRQIRSGVLYLDDYDVLQLEIKTRLNELDDTRLVDSIADVARWADEFEAELFMIDLR